MNDRRVRHAAPYPRRSVLLRVEPLEGRCLLATFTVRNTDISGAGSLLQAVLDSNAATGSINTIDFNIPGPGPHTIPIAPSGSAFPEITQSVTIDGYSQPGSHPNTLAVGDDAAIMIVLDGSQSGGDGLRIDADDCTIRGLAIGGFASADPSEGNGIHLLGGRHERIEGNFLGTDATGNHAVGNANGVVLYGGSDVTIGGLAPAARNIISGNVLDGIDAIKADAGQPARVVVQGNLIGTGAAGTVLSNQNWGLEVNVNDSMIGGTAFAAGNVIQGNGSHRYIPSTIPGQGVIALLTGGDIHNTATGSVFLGNTIGPPEYATIGPPNYSGGSRGGTNLPPLPFLTSAQSSRGGTTITGQLGVAPSSVVSVAFYTQEVAGPAEFVPIGTKSIRTDRDGFANFTFTTTKVVAAGQPVVATLIDPQGNYSDLSQSIQATALRARLAVQMTSAPVAPILGGPLVYTITVSNAGPDRATRVTLSDILPTDLAFLSARVSQGHLTTTGHSVAANLGSLPVGASATVRIATRTVGAGRVTNVARVSADQVLSSAGAVSSAVVRTVVSPSPTVTSAQRRLAGRHAAHLALTFSRAMDPASVQDVHNYRLSRLRRSGRSGMRPGPAIPLGVALYDPSSRTVTLIPRRPQPLRHHYLLTINGRNPSGLRDTTGRLVVGTGAQQPGDTHLAVVVASA